MTVRPMRPTVAFGRSRRIWPGASSRVLSAVLSTAILAACGNDSAEPSSASPRDSGDPRATLEQYLAAVAAGDIERALGLMPDESRSSLEAVRSRLGLEETLRLLRDPAPSAISVGPRTERGDLALFELSSTDPQLPFGRATLSRGTGRWVVVKVDWGRSTKSLGAFSPVPSPELPGSEWTLDLAELAIPAHPAMGRIGGVALRFDSADFSLSAKALTLGNPGDEFTIFLREGGVPDGRNILCPPAQDTESSVIAVSLTHSQSEGETSVSDMIHEGFALHLTFETHSGDSLPGEIYLCVDDAGKSYVAGRFEARIRD